MWYGHIRDLFTTAEGCMGSRLPNCNVVALGTTEAMYWCHVSEVETMRSTAAKVPCKACKLG